MKKYTKLFLLGIIFISSCNWDVNITDDNVVSKMKSPVVLISKNPIPLENNGTPIVTLRDATGKVYTCENSALAISLMNKNLGDTIK